MTRRRNSDDDPSVEVPYWRCARSHLSVAHDRLAAALDALDDDAVIARDDAQRRQLEQLVRGTARLRGEVIAVLRGLGADRDDDDDVADGEWPRPADYRP